MFACLGFVYTETFLRHCASTELSSLLQFIVLGWLKITLFIYWNYYIFLLEWLNLKETIIQNL